MSLDHINLPSHPPPNSFHIHLSHQSQICVLFFNIPLRKKCANLMLMVVEP